MKDSKLIELLRSLSGRQLIRLGEFVSSPYFNKNAELQQFFETIVPFAPTFLDASLNKVSLLSHFPAEKPLTEKRLAYLMNQLLGLTEKFMAIEQLQGNDFELPFARLDALLPGALARHYKSSLDNAFEALDNFPFRNATYYRDVFRLRALLHTHSDQNQHQFNDALQQASDALDDYFIVEKLRYCWAMANLEYMLNLRYTWNLGNVLLDYVSRENPALNPSAQVYYAGIRMVQEPDDTTHFFRLKELLQENGPLFAEAEQQHLYTGLLNYCTRRINRFNDQVFAREYLDINQSLLANGLLFEDGLLSPWHFINLVNTGLRAGLPEWTLDFIQRYRLYLPENYAEDVYLVAMGQYHYHLGEFGPAQVLLNQANPRDVLLAVTVRNLLTRIYYESGETELLLSFLEAYRIYLLRQELLSPAMRQQARRFVDFTRRLTKIDSSETHLLPKLRSELPDAAGIFHRDWLMKQIERRMEGK